MRRLGYIPIYIGISLLLGGCAEWLARASIDSAALYEAGRSYVEEIHDLRRFIRSACRASMVREIDNLIEAGDETALREMLAEHYPRLVTVDTIAEVRADPGGILAHAPGCGGAVGVPY